MNPRIWSTTDAPDSGLSYWIEAICEAFLSMKADSSAGARFAGRLEQHALGALTLNFIDADAQDVWRTRHDIARSTDNPFYLLHIRRGRLAVTQRGREAVVEAGHCVLVDSKEPYHFAFPEGDSCVSTELPERWLRTWLPHPEDRVAQPWGPSASGWGAVLAGALGNLSPQGLDALPLPASGMAEQIGALLALAGGPALAATTSNRAARLREARALLNDRFHEVELDPAGAARSLGVSSRYLHRLFAEAGTTFCNDLAAIRLARASRMLTDARFNGLAVAEIGWRCGFKDASHFARQFRRRFGVAPLACRKALR